jgi:Secretion system C-terminal sorting domain
MKNIIVFILVSACCLGEGSAQLWSFKRPLQQAKSSQGTSQKVAAHDDYPELYWSLSWDTSQAMWDSVYQFHTTYLPNGDVAEIVKDRYIGNTFVPEQLQSYSYATLPPSQSLELSSWNGSSWDTNSRFQTNFDAQGGIKSWARYDWSGATWDTTAARKNLTTYAFTNRPTSILWQDWSSTSHLFKNVYLEQYTYPSAAGWDTASFAYWNGAAWENEERYVDVVWHDFEKEIMLNATLQVYNQIWISAERFAGTIGAHDSPSYIVEAWSGLSWDTTRLELYGLDAHAHETLTEYYDWGSGWVQNYGNRTDYVYDGLGHTLQTTNSHWDLGQYVPFGRNVYVNFFTQTKPQTLLVASISAFPNPCTDKLNFKLELQQNGPVQIALYDLQGRLRMQTASPRLMDSQVTVPISEVLENGTYVYRIFTKEGFAEGKVIVQR